MRMNITIRSGLTALGLALCLSAQPALGLVTVTVQPTNQMVLAGSNPAFTAQVSTTAGETITAYTWQMSTNGLSPFTTIPGATTNVCTLTNVQPANAGYYFAKVYNGSTLLAVSEAAILVVRDQARIISQPQGGLIRTVGSNVTFSVSALGAPPLSYRWRLNGTNLENTVGRISGAANSVLTVSNLVTADSGSYDVVVTNVYAAVTSQVATLGVFIPVGISVPSQTNAVILGSNAVLTVALSGSEPLSYQWQQNGTNLSNGGRISGATGNPLRITAATTNDAGVYTVSITNPVSMTSAVVTLEVLIPATITSATNVAWRQGLFFSFTNTATGTMPILFGAEGLPPELSIEPTNGVISGIPVVTGAFNITVFATNRAMTTTGQLELTLSNGAPIITSALSASGKQGQNFSYIIGALNDPTYFSASPLPAGLSLNPTNGLISGVPVVAGSFALTIGVSNPYGADSRPLTLIINSAAPIITSARTATWTENQSGFSYTIRASNTPILYYGASDLPLGLALNTTNGVISGTPLVGGTFTVPIWAVNAWGTGSTNLVITVSYATPGGLDITDVVTQWRKPYLLDFTFSLRDGTDRATSNPLVRPPSQLQVVCMEDGVPISSEAPLILQSAASKQLKTHLVLDYTYSMYVVPGAIDAMEAAAELLINGEPPNAKFGIIEFNADYMAPQFVTNSLTRPTNYFISDKIVLSQAIAGIQDTYVQGNYAGSRCWDAMYAALTNFGTFGPNNFEEQRYLVAMTDGNDASSLLNSAPDGPVDTLIARAKANHVAIYCVGFGNNVNTTALEELTSQTGGRYYLAATTADLGAQFQRILTELGGQYALRWATLKRATVPAYPTHGFQPSFEVTYAGLTASWNTTIVTTNYDATDYTADPVVTNIYLTNVVQFPFDPPAWVGNVLVGSLRLREDADIGPQTVRLRAMYAPRFVRAMRLNYRPNYPCTARLSSTGSGEILSGWTMTETADTNGLRTLTLTSSDTNNLLTSIPYAAFGDLVEFDFAYPDALTTKQAFSVFSVDNSVYTNVLPSGISFTNENFASFITLYPPLAPLRDAHPMVAGIRIADQQPDRGGAERSEHKRAAGLAGIPGGVEPDECELAVRCFDGLCAGSDAANPLQHGVDTHVPGGNRQQPG